MKLTKIKIFISKYNNKFKIKNKIIEKSFNRIILLNIIKAIKLSKKVRKILLKNLIFLDKKIKGMLSFLKYMGKKIKIIFENKKRRK